MPTPMLKKNLLATMIASAVVATTALPAIAWAQSADANLRGKAPANSEITATNVATGTTRHTKANADGSYSLIGLPPGTYRIDAGPGTERTATLAVSSTATLDLAPAAGAAPATTVLEGVTVTAPSLVEVKTSEIGTNISTKQIEALPQNSRNFLAFADIVPGVQFVTKSDGSTQLKSGAQNSNGVNVYIDGVGQKNYVLKGGVSGQDSTRGNPFPQSAIAEYKVISSNYKAEFDQISSAAITAVTKSGTNEFHGDVFMDYSDQDFRAQTPSEKRDHEKTPTTDKQYGASFGGPIVQDLLHFFVAYEAKDILAPKEVKIGENVPIGALPPDLASQVGTTNAPFSEDLYFGKLTWTPGTQHLFELTGKYRKEADVSGIGDGPNTPSFGSRKTNDETRVDLRYQYNADTWLNDAHLTYEDQSWNPKAITNAPGYRLITPDRRAILNTGGGEDFQDKGQKGYSFQDDFTYTGFTFAGSHVMKAGIKYKKVDVNSFQQEPYNPQYFYDIQESLTVPIRVEFGQLIPGAGDLNVKSSNRQFGLYLQDDWDVTDKLQLNLGLRWDYEETPSYLDYVTPAPLVAALHGWANIQHTDYNIDNYISNGHNRDAFKDAWQPRLGFSYDLNGDEEHVIFGGAGRAYDRNLFDYLALEQSSAIFPSYGFDFNTHDHPCDVGNGTCLNWDPSYFNPSNLAALVAANPNLGGELNLINNNLKTPYSDQFSIGMRNNLGNWRTSATLVHIESHDGIVFTLGNRYPDGGFRGVPGATWGSQPWDYGVPGYGRLILANNGIETRLNSLLLSLEKPYTRDSGWGVTFAYTFSNARENRPNAGDGDEHYVFDYPNVDQVGWHRSLGVARHRLVMTGILDGPWGVTYSAKATIATPETLDATNCHDTPDFDHCYFDPFTPDKTIGFKQLDIAASKEWNLDDKMVFHFRIDVLNLLNTRNWTDYDTWRGGPTDTNPNFGTVNGLGVEFPTRTIKVSGRLSF